MSESKLLSERKNNQNDILKSQGESKKISNSSPQKISMFEIQPISSMDIKIKG